MARRNKVGDDLVEACRRREAGSGVAVADGNGVVVGGGTLVCPCHDLEVGGVLQVVVDGMVDVDAFPYADAYMVSGAHDPRDVRARARTVPKTS